MSQAIVISSVASHHSKCQHHFSSPVCHIFMSYHSTLLTNTVYSNQCHRVITFSDSILHAQCHGYMWYSGGEGCNENIYYTITYSCVYPATAFGKFQRDCLLKSDMSFGDFATVEQDSGTTRDTNSARDREKKNKRKNILTQICQGGRWMLLQHCAILPYGDWRRHVCVCVCVCV